LWVSGEGRGWWPAACAAASAWQPPATGVQLTAAAPVRSCAAVLCVFCVRHGTGRLGSVGTRQRHCSPRQAPSAAQPATPRERVARAAGSPLIAFPNVLLSARAEQHTDRHTLDIAAQAALAWFVGVSSQGDALQAAHCVRCLCHAARSCAMLQFGAHRVSPCCSPVSLLWWLLHAPAPVTTALPRA
jgi:hypothetical protein